MTYGLIGASAFVRTPSSDNYDYGYARANAAAQVSYRMPKAGLVEVWAELQAADVNWEGVHEDEWGISSVTDEQDSDFYLATGISQPRTYGWQYATIIQERRNKIDDSWYKRASSGGTRWVHLFSTTPYGAGNLVQVEFGVRSEVWFLTNDVRGHSAITSDWFLKRLFINSTG